MRSFALFSGLCLALVACVGDDPSLTPVDDPGRGAESDAGDGGRPPPDGGARTDDGGGGSVDAGADASADAEAPVVIAPPLVGPTVWLDARKLAPGAAPFKTWKDGSGNDNDATGGVALSVDPTGIDGHPGVYFPGETGQALEIPAAAFSFSLNPGFLVAFVAKAKEPLVTRTAQAVLFARRETGGPPPSHRGSSLELNDGLTRVTGTVYTSGAGTGQISAGVHRNVDPLTPHVYVFRVLGNKLDLWVDGVREAGPTSETEQFAAGNTRPFAIGGYATTNHAQFTFDGHIGQVLVYARAVSDADVSALVAKLRAEWGTP